MSEKITELMEKAAPVVCASCYLGYEKFEGDSVCANTAKNALEFTGGIFDMATKDENHDEPVSLEVFGDTVEDRKIVETTVGQAREGISDAIELLAGEAVNCAVQVGFHAINGTDGLLPTETYTKVEISRLSSPTSTQS